MLGCRGAGAAREGVVGTDGGEEADDLRKRLRVRRERHALQQQRQLREQRLPVGVEAAASGSSAAAPLASSSSIGSTPAPRFLPRRPPSCRPRPSSARRAAAPSLGQLVDRERVEMPSRPRRAAERGEAWRRRRCGRCRARGAIMIGNASARVGFGAPTSDDHDAARAAQLLRGRRDRRDAPARSRRASAAGVERWWEVQSVNAPATDASGSSVSMSITTEGAGPFCRCRGG